MDQEESEPETDLPQELLEPMPDLPLDSHATGSAAGGPPVVAGPSTHAGPSASSAEQVASDVDDSSAASSSTSQGAAPTISQAGTDDELAANAIDAPRTGSGRSSTPTIIILDSSSDPDNDVTPVGSNITIVLDESDSSLSSLTSPSQTSLSSDSEDEIDAASSSSTVQVFSGEGKVGDYTR